VGVVVVGILVIGFCTTGGSPTNDVVEGASVVDVPSGNTGRHGCGTNTVVDVIVHWVVGGIGGGATAEVVLGTLAVEDGATLVTGTLLVGPGTVVVDVDVDVVTSGSVVGAVVSVGYGSSETTGVLQI